MLFFICGLSFVSLFSFLLSFFPHFLWLCPVHFLTCVCRVTFQKDKKEKDETTARRKMPPIIYMSPPPPPQKKRRRRRNPQKNLMAGDSNQKRRNRNQCAVLLNWTWHLSKVGAVCSRGLYRTSCSSGGNSASSLVSTRYQTCKSVKWDLKKRMHRRKEGGEREK